MASILNTFLFLASLTAPCMGQGEAVGLSLLIKPLPSGPLTALQPNEVWTAKPGDTFDLDCHMEPGGNPNEVVTWVHNGRRFREGSRARIIQWLPGDQFQDYQIRFFNFSVEHGGEYTCLTSSMGNISGTIAVKPIVRFVSEKKTVSSGKPATFDCDVIGHPTPVVTWRHVASGRNWTGAQLVISRSEANDSGEYTCEGKNLAGTASARTGLDVIEPLSLVNTSNPEITIRTGDPLHLFCIARGSQQPLITWRFQPRGKGGVAQVLKENSSELILATAKQENSGTYSCEVRSSFLHDVGLTAHKELVRTFQVTIDSKPTSATGKTCPTCSKASSIQSSVAALLLTYTISFTLP